MTRRALVIILVLGLLGSLVVMVFRYRLEAGYRGVEIVLDGQDWAMLIRREGRRVDEVMRELRRLGAVSVALTDTTLKTLAEEGAISYAGGGTLASLGRMLAPAGPLGRLQASGGLRPDAVYITGAPDQLAFVASSLRNLLGAARVRPLDGALEVLGTADDLEELGLGFYPAAAAPYQAAGLEIVLRPRNFRGLTPESVQALVDGYVRVSPEPVLIFALTEVQGYEALIADAASAYRRAGAQFGRIEVFTERRKQRGEDRLTALMRPAVIRVFSVTPEELLVLRPGDVADRFVRAAQERNLRLLYVRPLLNTPAGTPALEVNLRLVGTIAERLHGLGFRTARPRPLRPDLVPGPPAASLFLGVLVALGAAALGLLVLMDLARVTGVRLPAAVGPAVLVVAGGGTLLAALTPFDNLWRQVAALAVAVAGAAGATVWAMPRGWAAPQPSRRPPGAGVVLAGLATLVRAVALAVLAGALVAALLSRWEFMLAFSTFLGVKAAHVLPVAVAAVWLAFARRPVGGWRAAGRELQSWFSQPLRVGAAIAALAVGLAAVMLLARTGNISLPLLDVEQRLRTVLEDLLIARPRTKEFLVGYPALALMGTAAALGWPRLTVLFGIVGAVGTAGAINSFSHLHTPLVYSAWRTVNALVLGAVLVMPVLLVLIWIARRRYPS